MRSESMRWLAIALGCGLLVGAVDAATKPGDKTPKKTDNSSNTIPLTTVKNVGDCIGVEAVLLPEEPAAQLFGGWVAKNYAVVKTTVSNHCADQQFILHNIYFDYTDWKLSGVYPNLGPRTGCPAADDEASGSGSKPGSSASAPAEGANSANRAQAAEVSPPPSESVNSSMQEAGSTNPPQVPDDSTGKKGTGCTDQQTQSTQPGQVATVGALDVQDQLTSASVFSPRNMVVNGLVLVGQVAQGYAFIGGMAAAQGIGAYNSAFVPNVEKLWPDRRINQEKNVLSLGYRTDQSTAVGKDDHGSYYAFFPLKTFLTPDLTTLFLNNPAAFINPAEVLLDVSPGRHRKKDKQTENLRNLLLDLSRDRSLTEAERKDAVVQLLSDLATPCPGASCPYDKTKDPDAATYKRILSEKYLFRGASLNSVKIVVRGVMTMDVNAIPPAIDTVTFDNEKDGSSLWTLPAAKADADNGDASKSGTSSKTDEEKTGAQQVSGSCSASKDLTGVITGKFLTDGTPSIVAISDPSDSKATVEAYIKDKLVAPVTGKVTDTSMPFKLTLCKTLASASKLTFQVTHSSSDVKDGTSTQTTSNKFDYVVSYAGAPEIKIVKMDNDDKADLWQTLGTLSGTVTGTDLEGGTLKVSDVKIDGKTAKADDYIKITKSTVVPDSDGATLDFKLTLKAKFPTDVDSEISFEVSKKDGNTTQTSKDFVLTIKKTVAAAKKPAAKAAAKAPAQPKKPAAEATR